MIITYRYRVKNLRGDLNRMADTVNLVWNYCNDIQKHAIKWGRRWPTFFDLAKLTAYSSGELNLAAHTTVMVCKVYHQSRYGKKRPYLKYRTRKSLGWIPLRGEQILGTTDEGFRIFGKEYKCWISRRIPNDALI